MISTRAKINKLNLPASLAAALGMVACAADPHFLETNSADTQQQLFEDSIMSTRVIFDYQDFFSLTSPNPSGCAGDARNFYDPLALRALASGGTGPVPFTADDSNSGGTVRPGFIKNISVDMTDANSPSPSNLAFGCSYGSGSSTIPPSPCSTFDYGANDGVSSDLSGSVLLVGGIQGSNSAGLPEFHGLAVGCGPNSLNGAAVTSCATSVYAFGVDALPESAATRPPSSLVPGLESASGPISSFVNLSSESSYNGPVDFIGGAGAYDVGDNQFALFGGSSVIGAVSATGQAGTNDLTWIFNLPTQSWSRIPPNPNINITLEETFEQITSGNSQFLSNVVTARANFGYTAVQGLGITSMSSPLILNGGTNNYNSAAAVPVDTTDRIVIAGGQNGGGGFTTDAYKFNPTYGPEWVDTMGRFITSPPPGAGLLAPVSTPPAAGEPVQWLVNYHTTPLFNFTPSAGTNPGSVLSPQYRGGVAPGVETTNFGLTALRDNIAGSFGAGYLFFMGGFDTTQVSGLNPSIDSCPAAPGTCGMMIYGRDGRVLGTAGGAGDAESYPANFTSTGNLLVSTLPSTAGPSTTTLLSPSYWYNYIGTQSGTANPTVPFFGGATLLPGFNLNTNDVVFFGGATCDNYLLNTTAGCSFADPGQYLRMSTDPIARPNTVSTIASVPFTLPPPQRAGMAAARGMDGAGNPIIVAFGGMSSPGNGTDTNIYYLKNTGSQAAPTPIWETATMPGVGPNVPTNGQLVYSHVTGNFYLFGGISTVNGAVEGDTWELSLTPASVGCGLGVGTLCAFQWTQLDVANGTVCSPSCPPARRSHRMVEVTYNNKNPGGTVGGVTSGEPTCSNTTPCSYAIFMEGGTADGVDPLGDRWLFDPTANGGFGLWQQMHEMPARTLAAMSSVDYAIPSAPTKAHRAVLFGGEMGLSDPSQAASGFFVPPTLGDTWMYDFDSSSWNRVDLLGVGFNGKTCDDDPACAGDPSQAFMTSETMNRQAFDATDTTAFGRELAELSPSPTSGAIMVTRTFSGPVGSSTTPPVPLRIPEVYMIGGRLKSGQYQPFDHVYKFCAGSTGEAYVGSPGILNAADFSCDAYDPIANPDSPSPSSTYTGRWLRKTPTSTGPAANTLSSFMGAGAYDPVDDLILVTGGMQFTVGNTAVTDPTEQNPLGPNAQGSVLEYTAPGVAVGRDGAWAVQGPCAGSPLPTPRYGHSMIYDSQHQQAVIIGGYDTNGIQLVETVSGIGGSYSVPDMWAAVRTSTGPGAFCYQWRNLTTIGNLNSGNQAPPLNGLSHVIAAYVPPSGYNTGFYSTFDSACIGVGPSSEPDLSKYDAGGVYFDLDRTQLGPNENVLLNLTFIPLGATNQGPAAEPLTVNDNAVFKIHLVKTGQTQAQLEAVFQPRYRTYTDNTAFPETVQNLAVVAPPTGQVRQEQVLIPLTDDPAIDRIRIERTSGTAILIDASLYRMGYK